ncbi:MAG: hypothetical protein QXO27_03230 [Candidatus Aenigmatarchaeota archaeon]
MLESDVKIEIEKLKSKILELTNKMNLAISFDEKEEYKKEIDILQRQIEVLEKLKT